MENERSLPPHDKYSSPAPSDVAYLRFVVEWPKGYDPSEENGWNKIQQNKHELDDQIRGAVTEHLGSRFEVKGTFVQRGSIEVLVVLGVIGVAYEAISKYKNFVESVDRLRSQIGVLLRWLVDPVGADPVTVSSSWTPGPALNQALQRGTRIKPFLQFFLWCAGADKDVLCGCPRFEYIKQAGYGSLVLIPAVLAFVSMSYALSTVTPDRYKSVSLAVAWAMVVFTFDRFIVSTFRKGASLWKDVRSGPFLARLFLSTLIGIVVAHPLVMLIFEHSITAKLDEIRQREINRIGKPLDDQIQSQNDAKAALDSTLSQLRFQKSQEISQREGQLISTIGYRRQIGRSREIRGIRDRLISERNTESQALDRQKNQINVRISELLEQKASALSGYNEPRDYAARENAFDELVATSQTLRRSQVLLVMLFVVIDLLPILFKVLTRKEAYDLLLDSSNKKATDKIPKDEAVYAELLDATTEYRRDRVTEIRHRRAQDPSFRPGIDADFDAVVKESLFPNTALSTAYGTPTITIRPAAEVASTVAAVPTGRRWANVFREKLKGKVNDAIWSLALIPLQAVLWLGWFLLSGTDILQYVSSSAVLEAFGLIIVNYFLAHVMKLSTGS